MTAPPSSLARSWTATAIQRQLGSSWETIEPRRQMVGQTGTWRETASIRTVALYPSILRIPGRINASSASKSTMARSRRRAPWGN